MHFIFRSIKKILFPLGLFIVTLIIGNTLLEPILAQSFFSLSFEFALRLGVWVYTGCVLCALSVGLWNKWEQYVFVVLPVALGCFVTVLRFSPELSIYTMLINFIVMGHGVFTSTQLKNNLIKFSASFVLRDTITAFTFVCAILAGILVYATIQNPVSFNIGQKISEYAAKPLKQMIEAEIQGSFAGAFPFPEGIAISTDSVDIQGLIADKVNSAVEPYRTFILPILALLMFASVQFYATLAAFIYGLTIEAIFALAKVSGFFRIEKEIVERQNLKF